jgi:hypothetical protein
MTLFPPEAMQAIGNSLNGTLPTDRFARRPRFAAFRGARSIFPMFLPSQAYDANNPSDRYSVAAFWRRGVDLFVDPYRGEVSRSDTKPYNGIPPLVPSSVSLLPGHLESFYASGYLEQRRRECLNLLFLKSCVSFSLGRSARLFSLSRRDWVRHLIRLLLYTERIDFARIARRQCPINFSENSMARDESASASDHLFHSAIRAILKYVQDHDFAEDFANKWLTLLIAQFNDPLSHFCSYNHPTTFLVSDRTPVVHCGQPANWVAVIKNARNTFRQSNFPMFVREASTECEIGRHGLDLWAEAPDSMVFLVAFPPSRPELRAGTFFELVVSLKYFIHFAASQSWPTSALLRRTVHRLVYESMCVLSPFFNAFISEVLHFLISLWPMDPSDLASELTVPLRLLGYYMGTNPTVASYLAEQQAVYDDLAFLPLKRHFPDFLSPDDRAALAQIEPAPPLLPPDWFSAQLEYPGNPTVMNYVVRCLANRERIAGMPIHFFLHDWISYVSRYPPFDIHRSGSILRVTFSFFVPDLVSIISAHRPLGLRWSETDRSIPVQEAPFRVLGAVFFLDIGDSGDVPIFILQTPGELAPLSVFDHVDRFTDDMKRFVAAIPAADAHILRALDHRVVREFTYRFTFDALELCKPSLRHIPIHLLIIRAHHLSLMNWFVHHHLLDIGLAHHSFLSDLVLNELKLDDFRALLRSSDNATRLHLHVDRTIAHEVREGASTDFTKTVMHQVTKQAGSDALRTRYAVDAHPFQVSWEGERGVDAGGPGRELFAELSQDLMTPVCGLVIPVPNARNGVGSMRDLVIPYPARGQKSVAAQYTFAGCLIGMCIRCGMAQNFNFPPLVWHYLLTGTVEMQYVYEIDENFRLLMTSLQEAQDGRIIEDAFASLFPLTFLVADWDGNEVPLLPNGSAIRLTLSNVSDYIARAKQFRVEQLANHLREMKRGLNENLGVPIPETVTWQMLEFLACGQPEVSLAQFRAVTQVVVSSHQADIFWQVVEALTSEERLMLIRFATSRSRLPPMAQATDRFLLVDGGAGEDLMPRASTCFHALHLPHYSSAAVALRLVRAAITFTGAFGVE